MLIPSNACMKLLGANYTTERRNGGEDGQFFTQCLDDSSIPTQQVMRELNHIDEALKRTEQSGGRVVIRSITDTVIITNPSHSMGKRFPIHFLSTVLITGRRRSNHLLGLSPLSEPVLESACHSLHETHPSGTGRTTALRLLTPIVLSHLTPGVPTRRTQTLLNMVRDLPTSAATCVALVMSLPEGGRSLRLLW